MNIDELIDRLDKLRSDFSGINTNKVVILDENNNKIDITDIGYIASFTGIDSFYIK